MHGRCGAAGVCSFRISRTVCSVPSRVEPPAPEVQEKNCGLNCLSSWRTRICLARPSGVRVGKNSKLRLREMEVMLIPLWVALLRRFQAAFVLSQ